MIRGVYTIASAMLTLLRRQQAISHNIVNLNTTGYKAERLDPTAFSSLLISRLGGESDQGGIGRLGTAVSPEAPVIDFSQGPLKISDQPLDLALTGDGFFQVRTPDGDRFTRDGRFGLNATGQIVNTDGHFVLSQGGTPIQLPVGEIAVGVNGALYVNGRQAGQIGVVTFPKPGALVRAGNNLFTAGSDAGAPIAAAAAQVHQGYLEGSNSDAASVMVDMMQVTRAYEAAQRMMQMTDEQVGKAANELGKI
ncbi:MAG: flagellar basal-body rod protein FlgF [Chloroflexi bacterium]|nr:flagellar basal-body rod protein FlgF [Chloroflexota bacterium]